MHRWGGGGGGGGRSSPLRLSNERGAAAVLAMLGDVVGDPRVGPTRATSWASQGTSGTSSGTSGTFPDDLGDMSRVGLAAPPENLRRSPPDPRPPPPPFRHHSHPRPRLRFRPPLTVRLLHVPDSSLPPSPPLLAKLLKFSQLETNVEESSLSSYSRRSTYVYMEEVEARTQKCRRPPTSRLALFGGLQGIESLSGGLGRVGGSRSSGPRSVRLAVQVLCRIFFFAASRRRVVCTRVATQN